MFRASKVGRPGGGPRRFGEVGLRVVGVVGLFRRADVLAAAEGFVDGAFKATDAAVKGHGACPHSG